MKKFKIVKLESRDYAIKKRVFLFFYMWICWYKRVHGDVSFEIKLFSTEQEASKVADFLRTNNVLYRIVREIRFGIE